MAEWRYSSWFSLPQHYMTVSGTHYAVVCLTPGKSARYPFSRKLGRSQSRSGELGEEAFVSAGQMNHYFSVVQPVTYSASFRDQLSYCQGCKV